MMRYRAGLWAPYTRTAARDQAANAAFYTVQTLASVNHFTDGCPCKWHK